jgi:SAM-dependent methyltransferase
VADAPVAAFTPAIKAANPASIDAGEDPWSNWPVWASDEKFYTKRFAFVSSITNYTLMTENGVIAILKDRYFLDNSYRRLLRDLKPKRIFEIGFFQGGMPLFLADMALPEKIVGIDRIPPTDDLMQMVSDAGLSDTVKLHGPAMQIDTSLISQILVDEFADRPIDLIIDDASHEYENSKVCFEEYFGYLRPGGKYVIEDWGWLHWPEQQSETSHFWGKPAMTNLVFEAIMTLASTLNGVIDNVEVMSGACVVITRGHRLKYRERVDLARMRVTAGREFHSL